jgi:excisionase family DNA binding protein
MFGNSQSTVERLLLTPKEAAEALGICERSLFALAERGELRKIHVGRAVRYSVDDLKSWIAKKSFPEQENT